MRRRKKVDWHRLNHILIPKTPLDQAWLRRTRGGRAFLFTQVYTARLSAQGGQFFVLMLLAALFALDVRRSHLYLSFGALTGLLLASILVSRMFRLTGVGARIIVPPRVAVNDPLTLTLHLTNNSDRDYVSLRGRGPFLGWSGEWIERRGGIAVLPRGQIGRMSFCARFQQRGAFHLDSFRIQLRVPFGLALGPPLVEGGARFLVVPRVAKVARLELPMSRKPHHAGVPRAAKSADSRELAGVRPYRAGDPVRDLHARTWARTGIPFVREYQEEFFTHIAVWVDTACTDELLEAALSLAAGLVERLLHGEALVDLLVARHGAPSGQEFLPLGRGRGTLDAALDVLATLEGGVPFDLERVRAVLAPRLEGLSALLAIVPTLDEPHTALLRIVEENGVACQVFVLDRSGTSAGALKVHNVDPAAVLRGEPV